MDPQVHTRFNSVSVFIFGFLSGVLASSFVDIVPIVSVLVVGVGIAVWLGERVWKGSVVREVFLLSLVLTAFGLGILRYEIKDFHEPIVPSAEGVVVSELEWRENTSRFVFLADNDERVLVSTDLYSAVEYGDRVRIEGTLRQPEVIESEVGRPFNYPEYLAKDDIYYTMSFTEVEVLSKGHGNTLKHFLFGIKSSLISQMRSILPEPESSLLAGLVVAGKGAMPAGILEEFRRAGIIHIVVLSGYNITIIAEFIRKFFENILLWTRVAGRVPQLASGASILGIILFVLMTGAEATVVRASIMVMVVILAKHFGKKYSAWRALLGAGFLMVIHNPKILVFDPSFQLSFLATCGLIFVSPLVSNYLSRIPDKWSMRELLSATLATQVTVLPFLIYSMGDVSLVSLPANILVLLFISFTMLLGFLASVIAVLSPLVAWPISFLTHMMLSWILGVSNVLGNLSFASVQVPRFSFWIVVIIYLVIIFLVKSFSHKLDKAPQEEYK